MGIYFHPPPPMMGGSQPYAPRELPPDLSGVVANDPPFTYGGPIATLAELVALKQPDPWTFVYFGSAGGLQPYGLRLLPPQITAVPENDPPYNYGGPVASRAEIVALAQPNPWVYDIIGSGADSTQPYAPRRAGAGIPGASVENPPFVTASRTAAQIALGASIAQPNPWVFDFTGTVSGTQPYAAKQMSPGIPGQSVNNPPFGSRRAEIRAEAVALTQPATWNYTFEGGWQPYAQRKLGAPIGIAVDAPPPNSRRAVVNAAIAAMWVTPAPPIATARGKVHGRLGFSKGYVIF